MKRYKAVIIGCGRIGAFFDTPGSEGIYTHAKAYYRHNRTQLAAVMDVKLSTANKAAQRWGCKGYSSVERLFREQQPDIVSICVPDEYHYDCLKKVADFRPRVVIAEKPLTDSPERSRKVIRKYEKSGIALMVNYSRRYDNVVQQTRDRIKRGYFGNILHTTIRYTKGILHNGSHAIDLANYLFGKVLSACVLSGRADFYRDDPSLNAYLSYKNCRDVFLLAGDERQYSLFEFDITGQKGRICFEQCGLRYTEYTVRSDPVYAGYRDLKKGVTHKTGLDKSLLNLVTNAVNHIERNEKIACSGDDALRAQEICSALLKDHFGGIKKCSNRQIKFFLL